MKKYKAVKLSFFIFLCSILCSTGAWTKPRHVLFVGNSYTYAHLMPWMLFQISRSLDPANPIIAEMVVRGGSYLQLHRQDGTALQLMQKQNWDAVVFQDFSLSTLLDRGEFDSSMEYFAQSAQSLKIQPYLYMTWARQYDPDKQSIITQAYLDAGQRLNASVVRVGTIWERVRRQNPEIELFLNDGSHPSFEGAYLIALSFYAQITGQSVRGATLGISYPFDRSKVFEQIDRTQSVYVSSFENHTRLFDGQSRDELVPTWEYIPVKNAQTLQEQVMNEPIPSLR